METLSTESDEMPLLQEPTLLQRELSAILHAQNASLSIPDGIEPVVGRKKFWGSVRNAFNCDPDFLEAEKNNNTEKQRRLFRGKITEIVGQYLLTHAMDQSAMHKEAAAIEERQGEILPMGRGYWRFLRPQNIEIYSRESDARRRHKPKAELDMIVVNEDGTEMCLVDFCSSIRTIRAKAKKEAANLPTVRLLCEEHSLLVKKLHVTFCDGTADAEPRQLSWKGQPIEDCHLVKVVGKDIVRHVHAAAIASWESDKSFRSFHEAFIR